LPSLSRAYTCKVFFLRIYNSCAFILGCILYSSIQLGGLYIVSYQKETDLFSEFSSSLEGDILIVSTIGLYLLSMLSLSVFLSSSPSYVKKRSPKDPENVIEQAKEALE